MPKARVFIIDDSVVARRMLAEVIGKDPGLEVAGTAANGRIALEKLPQVLPDLVTLDVSMPELGGLETLKELRRLYPDLPVLMVSAQTERGAETTIDALFLGAADYVTKPSAAKGVAASVARFNETLTDKARDLCAKRLEAPPSPPASNPRVIPPAPSTPVRGLSRKQRVEVVVLGASTGGPLVL
ncbi:MAG TPA: response regulator, partial [Planctomycetota bacterium]|nr:response regulator [Planctomycetota bacterium]